MNELEWLLKRVTLEPAYGPMFYQTLLSEPVYVLMPMGSVFTDRGTVQFIMWTGQDGRKVIPFFASREAIRRVLTPQSQSVRLRSGRAFLEACRGGIVVLNPNEECSCRLTAQEIALLLKTGSPNAPESYAAPQDMILELQQPDVPAQLLTSMSLLLSQIPDVERAYVVTMYPEQAASARVWLVAMAVESDAAAQLAAERMTALLAARTPSTSVDLLSMKPGSANAVAMQEKLSPFYDRARGGWVKMDAAWVTQ